MTTLFIDACPREDSRTRRLAEYLLGKLDGEIECLELSKEKLPEIDNAAVIQREQDVKAGDFSDDIYKYARQFALADRIVIAAPFWDLSFPAVLKKYIEAIMVTGITFGYTKEGMPFGRCKAGQLYYVTTAGGPIFNEEYGYGYIKALAQQMLGISDCKCFKAENLDIFGVDVEQLLEEAFAKIDDSF